MTHSSCGLWVLSLGKGWEFPSIEQLFSIVEFELHNPATRLPDTRPIYYWSSTQVAEDPDFAWRINFHDGSVEAFPKTGTSYVRAVRRV